MKSLLFIVCLLLITPTISRAEDWVHIYGEPSEEVYIDEDRVSLVDGNPSIHKIVVKVIYPNANRVKSGVAEVEINCRTKQWRETKTTLYDLKGNKYEKPVNLEWQDIEDEGGVAGAVLTFLNCLETK